MAGSGKRDWEAVTARWVAAGLMDRATADRVVEWERGHAEPGSTGEEGFRWPILVALALGALLVGAGVLLLVSAHWDELSPTGRIAMVVGMVGFFHAAGALVAERFASLAVALHAVGSIALGAGIALAGQTFHLQEHWPRAILLWAVGTALGWVVLGQWPQAALTAILAPWWLAAEWMALSHRENDPTRLVATGVCGLAFTYLSARRGPGDSPLRKALCWMGGLALFPAAAVAAVDAPWRWEGGHVHAEAWILAMLVPLFAAWLLRGRGAVWNLGAVSWSVVLPASGARANWFIYVWLALGAVGLVAWGIREKRAERVNLGIAGFALTVLTFYFSDVMDKMERSASLIGLGLLFLGGGWLIEKMRRRLIAQMRGEAA